MALLHWRKASSLIPRYCFSWRSSFSSSSTAPSEPAILRIRSSSSFFTEIPSAQKVLSHSAAIQSALWRYSRNYITVASTSRRMLARNCTTTAYPPPAPPQEFQGGDQESESIMDGPEGAAAMEGAEDSNMPPYDDANYPEDDEEYEDKVPPPDPEEKLLYSPSDED